MRKVKTFASEKFAYLVGGLMLGLLSVVSLVAMPGSAMAADPSETVTRAVDEIIEILNDPELAGEENSEERYGSVVALVDKFLDFREISMRTMGPRWRDIDDDQRQTFIDLFKKHLERNYIDQVDEYSDEKVVVKEHEIREDRRGNRYARVMTDFVMKDQAVPINYRMREKDGRWLVYDVEIEGVSLVRNFRSQFEPYSFDELIQRLEEGLATGENALADDDKDFSL